MSRLVAGLTAGVTSFVVYWFTLWVLRAALLLLLATPALADDKARLDVRDRDTRPHGHATIDRESGRIDTFDKGSRHTGYGYVRPDGRVDLYRMDGTRAGTVQPPKGRR